MLSRLKQTIGLLTLFVVWFVTGCSDVPSREEPATPGNGGWSDFYLQLSDGSIVYCFDKNREQSAAILSCDFGREYSVIELPKDTDFFSVLTSDLYVEGFVEDARGFLVMCIFTDEGTEMEASVMSCDWEHNKN